MKYDITKYTNTYYLLIFIYFWYKVEQLTVIQKIKLNNKILITIVLLYFLKFEWSWKRPGGWCVMYIW